MATPAILVPPMATPIPTKMMKSVDDFHHPAMEQLPHLAYCINDNPHFGKEKEAKVQVLGQGS
jgi:hypothetical protein